MASTVVLAKACFTMTALVENINAPINAMMNPIKYFELFFFAPLIHKQLKKLPGRR